jgi:hypothetical protein
MLQQRTAAHTRTAVLVCLAFLALAIPASAGAGTIYTERATDHAAATAELPQVGDRPAERAPANAAKVGGTSTSSSDDGADWTAIVGISLASLALAGFALTTVRRRSRVAPGH